jgi:hypothetical protein
LYNLLFWETGFWNKVCAAIQFEVCCCSLSLRSCWLLFSYISPYFYYMWGGEGLSQRLSKDMQKWSTTQIFVTPKLGSHDSWVTPKLTLNYSAATVVVMQLTPYLSQDCNSYHLVSDHDKNPTLVEKPFTWFGLWRGMAGPEGMGFCVG